MVVDTKDSGDRRYGLRTSSDNLLFYICLDEDGNEITQGMGKTLDVSERGIRIETHVSIDAGLSIFLTVAVEDELMDFKGNIVHTLKRDYGRFEYGMELIDIDEEKCLFLRQYMQFLKDTNNEE